MVSTPAQVRDFHVESFLNLDDARIEAGVVGPLRVIYDVMFQRRAGRADGNQFDLAGTDEESGSERLTQSLPKWWPDVRLVGRNVR